MRGQRGSMAQAGSQPQFAWIPHSLSAHSLLAVSVPVVDAPPPYHLAGVAPSLGTAGGAAAESPAISSLNFAPVTSRVGPAAQDASRSSEENAVADGRTCVQPGSCTAARDEWRGMAKGANGPPSPPGGVSTTIAPPFALPPEAMGWLTGCSGGYGGAPAAPAPPPDAALENDKIDAFWAGSAVIGGTSGPAIPPPPNAVAAGGAAGTRQGFGFGPARRTPAGRGRSLHRRPAGRKSHGVTKTPRSAAPPPTSAAPTATQLLHDASGGFETSLGASIIPELFDASTFTPEDLQQLADIFDLELERH